MTTSLSKITLKKLTINNFKGMKHFTADFSAKTDIRGGNGTGKTTIYDAFLWLLFDKNSSEKSQFAVRTVGASGTDVEVSAVLNIDGKDRVFKKTYRENWTKKRGEEQAVFVGNESLFEIDGVPKKVGEYKAYIDSILPEDQFKMLTSFSYFNSIIKWQDRRQILFSLSGDVDDSSLADKYGLSGILQDKSLADYKKSLAGQKKRYEDELKGIPNRLDELNNMSAGVEIQTGLRTVEEVKAEMASIRDISRQQKEELHRKSMEAQQLRRRLFDRETLLQEGRNKQERALSQLRNNLELVEADLKAKHKQATLYVDKLQESEKELEKLRADYISESEKVFKLGEKTCPATGENYHPGCLRKLAEVGAERFYSLQEEVLGSLQKSAGRLKEEIDRFRGEAEKYQAQASDLSVKTDALKLEIKAAEANLTDVDLQSDPEWSKLQREIQEAESAVEAAAEVTPDDRLRELESELAAIQSNEVRVEELKRNVARVEELKVRQRELSQLVADLDKQVFATENYLKEKCALLSDRINGFFPDWLSWKLFDQQINGGVKEVCELLVNGVPFADANNAARINAGIEIVAVLSRHFGLSVPLFVDNAESVNELSGNADQLIRLVVSDDAILIIENSEKMQEVA